MQFYRNIDKVFVKDGELVCYAFHLNPFDTFKQSYNNYEKNEGNTIVRLNTGILTKVKVKSINDVDLPDRASNN